MNNDKLLTMILGVSAASAFAGPVQNYSGLYFHEFTGPINGTEWSTWGSIEGEDRYEFSDLSAQGTYAGSIDSQGELVFDFGNGTGSFALSHNEADIELTLGGGFRFDSHIVRAPHTDDRFPVFESEHIQGNTDLSGDWQAKVSYIRPDTGELIIESTQQYSVLVDGDTIRLTDESGAYHQGVWFADDQAGFRAVGDEVINPRYTSFEGSTTSLSRDMIGDLRVLDDSKMTFAVFFQTQDPLGQQNQSMQYVELSRVPSPGSTMIIVSGALVLSRRRRTL